jgi:NACalpha-BTF3-like transcription factor
VSRSKAVKALKAHNGDIVGAIIELTEEEEEEEEEEEVDETGLNSEDIDLIVTQTEVSRSKVVKTLKTHNGDIVGAIMELIP